MVEWKKLGEIANLVRGKVLSKDYIRDNVGDYPVYSSQTANDGVLGCIDTFMFDGDFLTWTTDGAYAGTIFRRKGKFNITNVCGLIDIKENVNIIQDFLYYWLSLTAKSYVLEGMGNPKLMSNVASTIQIPIPSKAEQTRIVGILDTFTSAIANLKEQINERRKQYEYYRDQLLDLEGKDGVEMKTLGDVCDVLDSFRKPISKSKRSKGNYPYYGANGVQDYVENYLFDGTFLLMGEDGSVINKDKSPILHWVSGKIWVNNHAHILKETEEAQLRYIYYALQCCDVSDIVRGTPPKINQANMRNIQIPIPPKKEQSRIVSILDQFESSIANLEAQLKEREKQYEYYRNKLLTFEKHQSKE